MEIWVINALRIEIFDFFKEYFLILDCLKSVLEVLVRPLLFSHFLRKVISAINVYFMYYYCPLFISIKFDFSYFKTINSIN